jgi:cytochrome P450
LNVGLPRVSPGRKIGDHFVPSGTVVQINPYATARDQFVFSHPHEFLPERWLDPTPAMKAMSRPFSYGPRNCIGKHLAEIGLYLTLARLYQLFDVTVDPRTTDRMMEPKDIGVLEPSGERLYVNVKARGKQQH